MTGTGVQMRTKRMSNGNRTMRVARLKRSIVGRF